MNSRQNSMKCMLALVMLVIASCGTQPALDGSQDMVNPAAAFCQGQGLQSEIRTAPDGSQSGVCIFPDGSECDEWAYFRGECGPGGAFLAPTLTPPAGAADWMTYSNAELGYSFQYPPGALVNPANDPLDSLIISSPEMGVNAWSVSHPAGREEFRPPEGADLEQWLTVYDMLGETRLPDTQIGGRTAIHFRKEPSPQSDADDLYYFVKGTQLYLVTINHGAVEDWESANRFLQSWWFQ